MMLYPKFVYLELSFSITIKIHFVLKGTENIIQMRLRPTLKKAIFPCCIKYEFYSL